MYAAVYLDDHRAFTTRKGDDDMAMDSPHHIFADLLL